MANLRVDVTADIGTLAADMMLIDLMALAQGSRISIVQESPHHIEFPCGYSVSFENLGVPHSIGGPTPTRAIENALKYLGRKL